MNRTNTYEGFKVIEADSMTIEWVREGAFIRVGSEPGPLTGTWWTCLKPRLKELLQ